MTITPSKNTAKNKLRKRKTLSSAASNVAQAKAKNEQNGEIAPITKCRAEHRTDSKTGDLTLTAIFPTRNGRDPHHVNLSFLLAFPNLQPMFTEAFLHWGANVEPITRIKSLDSLRRYFFTYLKSVWSNMLAPEDIDDELLTGYRQYLLNTSWSNGKALNPTTVTSTLCHLRTILSSLTSGPWALDANRIAEQIPAGPRGAHRKAEPRKALGFDCLLKILMAAEREVLAIENRFANAQMLLAEGRRRLQAPSRITNDTRTDYRDFATCLAAVDEAYPVVSPVLEVLWAEHRALGWAMHTHGQNKIDSYLHPSSQDLVPFILLLAVVTVFNAETLLSLKWQNIDLDKDQAGTPAIEIVGAKGRASRDLVRLLDPNAATSSQLSLKRMLFCLRDITSRIRPLLKPREADYLFVFVPRNRPRRPMAFGLETETRTVSKSGHSAWRLALGKFIRDNKLPKFTLGQIRPSILDLVQFMDGSLEAARKVGDHRDLTTTWTYYTSDGVRARYRERVGQIILLRERWHRSNGVIDPRRLGLSQDKGAATPGFSCLNPFDSPRPNQQPGKLCKDYGGCPSCPLAAAHPNDPLCVAQYTALETAIYRSQSTMNAMSWIERWTPVLADLAALRAWVPQDVLTDSRKISITLPNVG